jgi:hypothetical protein
LDYDTGLLKKEMAIFFLLQCYVIYDIFCDN